MNTQRYPGASITPGSLTPWPANEHYARSIPCPTCGAQPTEPCYRGQARVRMERAHTRRQDRAIKLYHRDLGRAPEVEDRVVGKRYDSLEGTIHDPWLLVGEEPPV